MAKNDYTQPNQNDHFKRYESADMLGVTVKHRITGDIGRIDCIGIVETIPPRFDLYIFSILRRGAYVTVRRKSELDKDYIRMHTD